VIRHTPLRIVRENLNTFHTNDLFSRVMICRGEYKIRNCARLDVRGKRMTLENKNIDNGIFLILLFLCATS